MSSFYVIRDGGKERGRGTLCAGSWSMSWYKLLPLLKTAGHVATAIDLASCGIYSMDANQIQTWSDLNEPLIRLFNSLPPQEKVILVGYNMGGMSLSLMMEQFPDKIKAAVFLTAFMPLSGSSAMEMISEVLARLYSWGDTEFIMGESGIPTSFKFGPAFSWQMLYQNSPTEDIELGELLKRKFPIIQGEVVFSQERYGRVPRVYVVTKDDNAIWEELQRKMIAENSPDRVYEMEGSDHSAFFCYPHRLAEILDEISSSYNGIY
ncbi:hypothetical protein SUGI_0593290 [Cryptomeria japonica]|uniref:methylesterase 8-like n=1 Tax=Cryptomeria japonica TaxID=3369 RepID=UPI00241487E9|nr:methylesterase 8-like [Cryptomeria japonica]GLJ30012.1 hypothetical protein SUGI_0593290 [Cryptomeria japonica]